MGDWPVWELTTLGILGLGVPLAGVARWRKWDWLGAAIAGAAGCFAIAAAATGQAAFMSLSCAGFAGVVLVPASWQLMTRLASRNWVACAVRISRSRALQALPFLLAGPLLTFVWAERIDQTWSVPDMTLEDGFDPPVDVIKYPHDAHTDRGRAVPLFTTKLDPESDQALANAEKRHGLRFPFAMLRLSPPDPVYDCHGWVFTGGRFRVKGQMVDTILNDNGYQIVSHPQAGDLIIYRDDANAILHSGIVRCVHEVEVTIESKWGCLGRYLHNPKNQPYDKNWAYYRSPREGHLLHMDGTVPTGQVHSAE